MTDDVSSIPTSGCNVLTSDTQLYNYSSNVRRTYRQVGGKWIFTAQDNYNTLPANYQCIDLSVLSSHAEFLPIYNALAFGLVMVVIILWFSVIKRVIRWRL